jgi:hypothetical protein
MIGPVRPIPLIPPIDRAHPQIRGQQRSRRLPPIARVIILVVPMIITTAISPISVQADESIQRPTQIPAEIPAEIPEEVLRQEIILDGRSPLDGQPLTATEYAELQAELERLNEPTPMVSPKLQQLVMLVKLRKFLKTVLPILPMK